MEIMMIEFLQAYFNYLCDIRLDFMSSEERRQYRQQREKVATLLAFPELLRLP
jgi:hypothetical protein